MNKQILLLSFFGIILFACNQEKDAKPKSISDAKIEETTEKMIEVHGKENAFRIKKGVSQAAAFWREEDGTEDDFYSFCFEHFKADDAALENLFVKLSRNYEILWGNFNQMTVSLNEPLHKNTGEAIDDIDLLFGSYDVSSHTDEDFFTNKIAFIVLLNFPHYSLEEKNNLGKEWSEKDWAYARMGDIYSSRIPSALLQEYSRVSTDADAYIAGYNIIMHQLIGNNGEKLFEDSMALITHWGLRDELKSNYNIENGKAKQDIIYEVMKRIIYQEIPDIVVNNDNYEWNPYDNIVFENKKAISFEPEADMRYQYLLNLFTSLKAMDNYNPYYDNYIQSRFEGSMEISCDKIESLFEELLSSKQVKKTAEIIKKELGRDLEAYDIWFNGFTPRNSISEKELNAITQAKYPNEQAVWKDLSRILVDLGFSKEKAAFIQSKITVDASRGAGHAWGAEMKSDNARLRTRIGENGMDYKGYNIAVHEFGHNVEQTITLHDVEYYMLHGVPNTAFTEAIAFFFQKRDLELLGIKEDNPMKEHYLSLEVFWSAYEIMGVSLVDIKVWKWMYEHPDATKTELKTAVIDIAKEVWNTYYADVFGKKDEPILAIYSHMISSPLYLSAYPVGHLIHFQIEQEIKDKDIASELQRMLVCGRKTPNYWMKNAVGEELSNQALLKAVDDAVVAYNEMNTNENE